MTKEIDFKEGKLLIGGVPLMPTKDLEPETGLILGQMQEDAKAGDVVEIDLRTGKIRLRK